MKEMGAGAGEGKGIFEFFGKQADDGWAAAHLRRGNGLSAFLNFGRYIGIGAVSKEPIISM